MGFEDVEGDPPRGAKNVLDTVLLSVLRGHWRYTHINGIGSDGGDPGLSGMSGTINEDVGRMAMRRIGETAGLDCQSSHILSSGATTKTATTN